MILLLLWLHTMFPRLHRWTPYSGHGFRCTRCRYWRREATRLPPDAVERFWRALCRLGLHVMRRDERRTELFVMDLYSMCQCGRQRLPLEVAWRACASVRRAL